MKIAKKHRTNNCKDYDHTVIIENLKEHKTLLSSIFLFGFGLGYTIGFLFRSDEQQQSDKNRWSKFGPKYHRNVIDCERPEACPFQKVMKMYFLIFFH